MLLQSGRRQDSSQCLCVLVSCFVSVSYWCDTGNRDNHIVKPQSNHTTFENGFSGTCYY